MANSLNNDPLMKLTEDERLLIEGYRAASNDRRGDMLDFAKKAINKKRSGKIVQFKPA